VKLADLTALVVTVLFAAACAAFVRQPTLASFADDSVSYLIMAQVFSPFQPASQAVAAAFAREAFYPPLFPLVLALGGAAHDFAWAHVLTALLLAAALPVVYLLGARWLESRWAALLATLCIALLPSLWINAKGILSEPLFCLLLALTLLVREGMEEGRAKIIALSFLLAALALTRTAGLALAAAYAAWAVVRGGESTAARMRACLPALAAFLAYAAWIALRPASAGDENLRLLLERQPWRDLAATLGTQLRAVAEAWIGSLVVFWVEGQPLRLLLAGLLGAAALAGMLLRLRAGKADAWMMAAYFALYLAWPFADQMERFLFPVLPVLVLYAFVSAGAGLRALGRGPALAHGVAALLLLSLTVPAMAFVMQRAGAQGRQAAITDWYRTPGLDQARARAEVHLALFDDMARIRALTGPQERVMWVTPAYIALLADRQGLRAPAAGLAPAEYRRLVELARPDHVFLSAFHPRNTVDDGAWRTGRRALEGYGRVVHATPDSILIKVAAPP
jgi:hypothetical protein